MIIGSISLIDIRAMNVVAGNSDRMSLREILESYEIAKCRTPDIDPEVARRRATQLALRGQPIIEEDAGA